MIIIINFSFFEIEGITPATPEPKKRPSNRSLKIINSNHLNLDDICKEGNTFLWDLLVNESTVIENFEDGETTTNNENELFEKMEITTNDMEKTTSKEELLKTTTPNSYNSSNGATQAQILKLLKEAEKQLQTLLCLPSTDKRIRMKFIESCLLNLKSNKACIVSLKLLIKLFGSFQQYATSLSAPSSSSSTTNKSSKSLLSLVSDNIIHNEFSSSTISQAQEQLLICSSNHKSSLNNNSTDDLNVSIGYNAPSNIIEVHKIVAFTEYYYSMINIFFDNLVKYTKNYAVKLKMFKIDSNLMEDSNHDLQKV